MTSALHRQAQSGFAAALGAYLIWGFLPLYLILVREVPPVEFVGWRIIWTLPFCLAIVAVRGQWGELRAAFSSARKMAILFASAALIGINWLIYVWAIQSGHVYAASLGYYLNPLINVLLGTALLGERLSRAQWIAVALAGIAVVLLVAGALTTLWISLALAFSFGFYGLLRKQLAIGSVPGLTIESALLLPLAAAIAWVYAGSVQGSAFFKEIELSLAIMLGGVVTAVPLLLFAIAARRLPYSTLGFIQYLAPTIVFLLGLFVFAEPLNAVQAGSFALIWSAIAIFMWDLWRRSQASQRAR